ncbi:hypothetical protein CK203_062213 [Vitis vinifera]|uniref:Uncharacterized protein n=1 Tax=Vitis vinifera TaxID=29760 RepID=A0A438G7A4_VITVI|nr:hypothetical protein CK203_062213 [Vitis vinifera]
MKGEESSSKAEQGSKTKETEHLISRCQIFAHLISRCENFAHPRPRCEILGPKEEDFAHPYLKVRNQFQGAKSVFKVRISKNPFSHTTVEGAKIFALCEILSWHTCANFAHLKLIFARCETVCENFAHHYSRCENFAHLLLKCEIFSKKGAIFAHPIPRCEMDRSRCENFARPEEAFPPPILTEHSHGEPPWEPHLHLLFRPRPFPHLRGKFLLSADTPPGGHPPNLCRQPRKPTELRDLFLDPPAKRTKFSGPREPSHAPQPEPATEEPRIPVDMPPEAIIRRPMIAGPPIEGNLDCRDRSFHSETYFDIEALRQQPELRDSSDCCRGLHNPTLIQFTIDGPQGAIGARHIAEALRIPYEPVFQADFREWSSFSQSDMVRILSRGTSTASVLTRRELPSGMLLIDVLLRANLFPLQHKVQRRGAILEALFRISEGYFFGPHHLIMTSLLHFEEKVHRKKLQRADGIPLLFPRLLCQILEHLGYPEEPPYFAPEGAPAVHAPPELPRDEQIPQAQQDEILTETPPPAPAAHPSVHMPGAIHSTSPITQGAPPVVPATPAPPPSSEPTITVSLTEFRGLERSLRTLSTAQDSIIHQMATIRAHQDQIIATQAQHTTILHQIQQHLSMQTPLGHDRSAPSEPLVPDEESLPAEQPIPEEEIRAEPSHDPTHI